MSSSIDNNGYIKNGMRADIFRMSVENKNILSHPYSMYVGTGESVSVSVSGDSYLLPKTGELTPGESGHVLLCKSSATYGLSFEKISPDSLATNIVYNTKAAKALTADYCALAPTANVATYNASKEWVIEDKLASLERQNTTLTGNYQLEDYYGQPVGTVRVTEIFKESGFCSLNFSFVFFGGVAGTAIEDFYRLGQDIEEECSAHLPLPSAFLPKQNVHFFLKRDKIYDSSVERKAVIEVFLKTNGTITVRCVSDFGNTMLDSFSCNQRTITSSAVFPCNG